VGAVSSSVVGVAASKLAMVDIIEREFAAAGYPVEVAAAAVVNAYAESGLDPLASGDNGNSVGLFQLNIRGAGAGMTVAARQDPVVNTRTLITRERRALGAVTLKAQAGESLPALAAAFSTLVERPKYKAAAEAHRAALALRLFPLGVRASTSPVADRSTASATKRSTNAAFLWGTVALASIGFLAILHDYRARSRAASLPRSLEDAA
jgi:hypothetical protein